MPSGINVSVGVLSDYIHSGVVQGLAYPNHDNMFINLMRYTHTMVFVDAS